MQAAATLTVTPLTWNIIGLDSNGPADGPNRFPVGVRICNNGDTVATDVVVDFAWDDGNDLYSGDLYINLRPGSLSSITISSIAADACSDAYFEVEVTRNAAAFEQSRRYHITATDKLGATGTSPQPRELYVEHLISQNRNGITSIKLDDKEIPAGGTMTMMVGNTYKIELLASTATQGYNQLESFINISNTIFQIESVSTEYSSNTSSNVLSPDDKLYADACLWENDPDSPNYLSCTGGTDKSGGDIIVTYIVKILSGSGSSETMNSLIYDFSGSSFHYNADYLLGSRIVEIISSASVTIAKAFVPKAISPDGTSTLTFTLSNPTPETITGVKFTDNFPTVPVGLMVATNPNVTYNNCGSGTFSPAPASGDTLVSFSNGTLLPNSTCTITVDVTAAATAEYSNTTGNLLININDTEKDTGNTASDTLTVADTSSCLADQTLVHWTVPVSTTLPPDTTGGAPSTNNTNYDAFASFSISVNQLTGTSGAVNPPSGDDTSWQTFGYKTATAGYVEFKVDTRDYDDVSLTFSVYPNAIGPDALTVAYDVGLGAITAAVYSVSPSSADDSTLIQDVWNTRTIDLSALTNTEGVTIITITGTGAQTDNTGSSVFFDDIK